MRDSSCYSLGIDQKTNDLGDLGLATLVQQASVRDLNSGHCHETILDSGIYSCLPTGHDPTQNRSEGGHLGCQSS